MSYFAGGGFRTKDAVRSRFLDVLVRKKKNKAVNAGATPSNTLSRSNPDSSRKVVKRELHSEANAYFNSAPSNSILKPNSNRNNAIERMLITSKGSSGRGSMTKAEVDSPGFAMSSPLPERKDTFNADQLMPPKTRTGFHSKVRRKSWDDWEPSGLKNLVKEVPTITAISPRPKAADRKQVPPFSQPKKQPIQRTYDSGKVIPQRRVRQVQINSNEGQTTPSFGGLGRSYDENQMARHKPTSQDANIPPEMDSTMFYPVGSTVKHRLYGQGIVQNPPKSDKQFVEKSLVRVKFLEDNLEWDLPMDGLVHTFK